MLYIIIKLVYGHISRTYDVIAQYHKEVINVYTISLSFFYGRFPPFKIFVVITNHHKSSEDLVEWVLNLHDTAASFFINSLLICSSQSSSYPCL